eukprot:scaffold12954_cov105-Isochrysis_galbana.AAC.3
MTSTSGVGLCAHTRGGGGLQRARGGSQRAEWSRLRRIHREWCYPRMAEQLPFSGAALAMDERLWRRDWRARVGAHPTRALSGSARVNPSDTRSGPRGTAALPPVTRSSHRELPEPHIILHLLETEFFDFRPDTPGPLAAPEPLGSSATRAAVGHIALSGQTRPFSSLKE